MAISWSEDISSGAPIQKSNLAEIKSEIDNLASWEGVSLSWNYFESDGTPTDSAIKTEQAQELRDKTDTIHNNRHSAVYSGENSGDNGSDEGTYYDGYDSSDHSDYDRSVT